MNLVAILIGLVILAVFLTLLYRILVKILPQLGVDGEWINIIFGIIGLAVLILIAGWLGYLPGWVGGRH
jgi:hypothetical protein